MVMVVQNAHSQIVNREKLEAIAGVEQVLAEGDRIWLLCRPEAEPTDVRAQAEQALRDDGIDPESLPLEFVLHTSHRDRQRVRFEDVQRIEEPDMRVRVRVTLEWRGERVVGEATGEKGGNIELRTAAQAAVAALEHVSDRNVDVRLAGVKQVRAFDAELMVVSLYRPGPEFNKYLGAVLVGKDPLRAAALAVLHALNRVLGNYLVTR